MIERPVRPPDGRELVDVRVTANPVFISGVVPGVHGVTEYMIANQATHLGVKPF